MSATNWNLIKMDATKILCNWTERDIIKEDGNYKVAFKYDLSGNNPIGREIISIEDKFADNALFFQLREILIENSNLEDDEDAIRSTLIFIDFKDIFFKEDWSSIKLPPDTPSKDELRSDKARINLIEWLFKDGLELSFDGKNFKRFVPFDKSSSMSKKCQITFIDSQIKDVLDRRLMLDMDFIGERLVLSRFYAYRGLYLSTGYRVEPIKNFPMNEETVMVLDDCIGFLERVTTLSAFKQDKRWIYNTKEKNLKPNLFDGEGFISPDFAEYINKYLKKRCNFLADSHSFQIRMPFIKGVVHEVDFNQFFSEQLQSVEVNELLINDFFGITRDLRKAKIILTKSMFKCAKWMKSLIKKDANYFGSDPMKFFFEKFAKYNHAIYITSTEARLSNPGYIRLNHQFLSTLALSVEDFNSLVADHRKIISSFEENFTKSCSIMFDSDDYDSDDTILRLFDSQNTCLKALAKNSAFLKDPKAKDIFEGMKKSYACDLGLGHLEIEGEQRFLSCDLLTLLIKILAKVKNIELEDAKKNSLKKECLYQDRFFMPENKISVKPDKYYVFLRNPHLSRNEQVILRSYVKPGSLYEKYFSHLKGLVMVSAKSTAAMALGGADFDGDLVKIISDKRIVRAVWEGKYKPNLPIVEIPSTESKSEPLGYSIPLQIIIDTFANKVGLISDWAVQLAEKEYYSETVEEKYKDACAKCTIVVGLEIDAAKSGNHPEENIKEIKAIACGQNTFLDSKKIIEKIRKKYYSLRVDSKEGKFKLYLSKSNKVPDLEVTIERENSSILERLSICYLRLIFDKLPDEGTPENVKSTQQQQCFNFEIPNWSKNLDESLKKEVGKLIKAYCGILSLYWNVQQTENFMQEKKFKGHVINILKLQYDDYRYQKLPCGIETEIALKQLYAELSYILDTNKKIKNAIEALKTYKWHLTCKESRPTVVAKILGLNSSDVEKLPPFFELLYNFRCNGFMLFYYVLEDLKSLNFDKSEYSSQANASDKYSELNQNPYYNELYRVYSEGIAAKKSKSIWNAQVIKICRQHLHKIFDGNISEALKYYWAQKNKDPKRKFFWDVFNEQEILSQIFIP